ncbi:aminoacyl-tRNA deacylase [Marinobacter sp. SS21]|uniref:aminoacyl-tRNA deacylase n=1 Tax=Marinobacter sp. SS21 TaxID=2979460 RepID=UPI0023305CF3|nr:YbaK/EbsC family protein [Marinobacter sp. SS21]MDC0661547.1 YbaK/EbsC family protein [Marinobacter sp. SS21]
MISERLRNFLEQNLVKYHTEMHPSTPDAMRTAQAAHVPGREFAKTVIFKADGRVGMAVLPATDQVHLAELRKALGSTEVSLASEEEMKAAFPDCDIGAMPPFGNLYDMEVFVSEHLRVDESITFNAGSHDEVMKMSYRDYERLVHPNVVHF